MINFNGGEIKKRLAFLLEKAELSPEEIQWLLHYLEQSQGQELQEILLENIFSERQYSQEKTKAVEYNRLKKIFLRIQKKTIYKLRHR